METKPYCIQITEPCSITIPIDDFIDEVESRTPSTQRNLKLWFDSLITEEARELRLKAEFENTLREAIESVTKLQPEHIIIEYK